MHESESWDDLPTSEREWLREKFGVSEIYFGRPVLGKIIVLPLASAEEFDYRRPWACISIVDSHNQHVPNISENNRVAMLRMTFDDINRDIPGYKSIDKSQAREILEFAKNVWDKVDLLMIHCNAGIRRSPACGHVISEKFQPEFSMAFFQLYFPNSLVVKTLREVKL